MERLKLETVEGEKERLGHIEEDGLYWRQTLVYYILAVIFLVSGIILFVFALAFRSDPYGLGGMLLWVSLSLYAVSIIFFIPLYAMRTNGNKKAKLLIGVTGLVGIALFIAALIVAII